MTSVSHGWWKGPCSRVLSQSLLDTFNFLRSKKTLSGHCIILFLFTDLKILTYLHLKLLISCSRILLHIFLLLIYSVSEFFEILNPCLLMSASVIGIINHPRYLRKSLATRVKTQDLLPQFLASTKGTDPGWRYRSLNRTSTTTGTRKAQDIIQHNPRAWHSLS